MTAAATPSIGICEFTTMLASFDEDLDAYAAAGVEGIGICELKLADDTADLARFRASGLRATHCVPAVPSILPLPLMEGASSLSTGRSFRRSRAPSS